MKTYNKEQDFKNRLKLAMVIIAIFTVIYWLTSCSEENTSNLGCVRGISKSNPNGGLVRVRCCTREEFLAGSNVNQGGVSYWSSYTNHKWEPVNDCSECN